LNITILNSHEIVEETLNWNLDFGLVEGDASALPQGLQVEVFAHDELVLVVSPKHGWKDLPAILPTDLRDGQLLMREQGSGIREVIEHALLLHDVQVRPLLTVPDNEAIKQMVMSGVGAAIVSALAVKRELASSDLVRVPIAGLDLRPELSLVKRTDKQLSRAAQAFCALLHLDAEHEERRGYDAE
jgi:DNA-binding transcriptional LysR family regulator